MINQMIYDMICLISQSVSRSHIQSILNQCLHYYQFIENIKGTNVTRSARDHDPCNRSGNKIKTQVHSNGNS